MSKYIVIYDSNSGFAQIENVGLFEAKSEPHAIDLAKNKWGTTAILAAFDLDECEDGWSYYYE